MGGALGSLLPESSPEVNIFSNVNTLESMKRAKLMAMEHNEKAWIDKHGLTQTVANSLSGAAGSCYLCNGYDDKPKMVIPLRSLGMIWTDTIHYENCLLGKTCNVVHENCYSDYVVKTYEDHKTRKLKKWDKICPGCDCSLAGHR